MIVVLWILMAACLAALAWTWADVFRSWVRRRRKR